MSTEALTLEQLRAHAKEWLKLICESYPIPRRLIDAHAARLDFERLSRNEHLDWDEALLDAYAGRWDWRELASNGAVPVTVALVKKHVPKRWSWDNLMWQPRVFADPELLALCLPRWERSARRYLDPDDDRSPGGYQYFQFIPWGADAATWAPAVLEGAKGFHWDLFSAIESFPWTVEFLERNAHRLDWKRLSWNGGLPWSVELLRRFEDRWSWASMSPKLPWSEELLAPFVHRWSWRLLTLWVPWTEALLDRFADHIYWAIPEHDHGVFTGYGGVIDHEGYRWTPALYERHRERVERHLASLAGEVDALRGDDEHGGAPWTFHCSTANWAPEMFEHLDPDTAIDWEKVCSHAVHPWSDDFIAKHAERLRPHLYYLSNNAAFPRRLLDALAPTDEDRRWFARQPHVSPPADRLFAELERDHAQLRARLEPAVLEALLDGLAGGKGAGKASAPPPPPKAPGKRPHPTTPSQMAALIDRLWTGGAHRELASYGKAVLAYFAQLDDLPDRMLNDVLAKTGIGCAYTGDRAGIAFLERQIERTGDAFHHANIGRLHLTLGDFDAAHAALDRAPASSFYAMRVRAQVFEAAGRLDDAEAWYRKAIADHPQDVESQHLLAALQARRRGATTD